MTFVCPANMKLLKFTKRLGLYHLPSSYTCCVPNVIKMQSRKAATMSYVITKKLSHSGFLTRNLGLGPTSKDFDESGAPLKTEPLNKSQAHELILHLTDEERKVLFMALQEYDSNRMKEDFEDKLAGIRWRSKFGRPSKVPTLGDVDPTGSYCLVPDDWLKKKYTATVPKPTNKELFQLSISNAVPFIGFGFLDNFIMIIAGDSIDSSVSAYITISTMAAAAIGNTFSDVIGIGSSYYVERAAFFIGIKPPKLSPIQLDMNACRRVSNLGRVIGITIGCFLGMTPLLFMDSKEEGVKTDAKDKKS